MISNPGPYRISLGIEHDRKTNYHIPEWICVYILGGFFHQNENYLSTVRPTPQQRYLFCAGGFARYLDLARAGHTGM